MRAYFAVGHGDTAERLLGGHRTLMSFAYLGTSRVPWSNAKRIVAASPGCFLDSGAFTAWKSGRPIILTDYLAHIVASAGAFERIAALDDIESPTKSLANWRNMLAALAPDVAARIVPVFHEGEPLDLLDEYVETAYVVGLGRTDGRNSKPKTYAFYDECFNRHPLIRAHAFGCGDPARLEPYPFDSFDCTTWECDSTYAEKHGWPWSRVSKETRMRAYIEALETIEHRPAKQLSLRMSEAIQ